MSATTAAPAPAAEEDTGRATTAAPVALDPPLGAVAANLGANVTLFRSLLRPGVHFPSTTAGNGGGDADGGGSVGNADPLRFLKHPRWRGGPMASSQRIGVTPTPAMSSGGSKTQQQPTTGVIVAVLLPDPHDAESTFYRTRRAALCERGYGLEATVTPTTDPATAADDAAAPPTGTPVLQTPVRPSGRALPADSPASAAGSPAAVAPGGPPRQRTLLEDDRGSVVVAIDHASGTGAKKFNTLPRCDVLEFVSRSSMPNLYVAVDPELPLDPFFDIDLHIAPEKVWELAGHLGLRTGNDVNAALPANHSAWTPSQRAVLTQCFNECSKYVVLHDALNMVILPALVNFFRSPVDHLAVFDASACTVADNNGVLIASNPPQFKVSFHVHARMRNGLCFRNVGEHKRFALVELPRAAEAAAAAVPSPVRQRQHRSEQADAAQAAARSAMAREFSVAIDTAVYTSWRMFRLPWCCKRQAAGRMGPALVPMLPDSLPSTDLGPVPQLRETLQRLTVLPAERSAAAMPQGSSAAALVMGLPHPVRLLLGGATDTDEAGHKRAFVLWRAMELSLITRSPTDVALAGTRLTFKALGSAVIEGSPRQASGTPGRPAAAAPSTELPDQGGASASPAGAGAGGVSLAPLRVGRRVAVVDDRASLLLRLFQTIDSHYDPARAGPLAETAAASGEAGFGGPVHRLTRVEAEDNGQIRMYYAMQKQSRWCLRQGRAHKKTHGQLYVTFGSIKYRCYSNDCHDACVVIGWTPETLPLRDQLFPALPVEELRRRYPHRRFESADDTGSDFDVVSVDGDVAVATAASPSTGGADPSSAAAVAGQEEIQLSRQLDEALSRQD